MSEFSCSRCGQTQPRLTAPPLPNELGDRIYDSICQACWQEWLRQQTAIINHYGLDLREPKARQLLMTQTEAFFFGPPQT
jgi:Fe-S cluster biosynthesis and repair protein YggX